MSISEVRSEGPPGHAADISTVSQWATRAVAQEQRTSTAFLEVCSGSTVTPAIFPLNEETVIGRGPQDSLASDRFMCIPEHTVSRRHARLRRRGDGYSIEDLHSYNGTFLCGNRLRPGTWYALRDGDEVRISSVELVFRAMAVARQASPSTVIADSLDATLLTKAFEEGIPLTEKGADLPAVRRLRAMAQVSIALGAVRDRETVTTKIMDFVFELFPLAERAFILLVSNEREPPIPVAARRRDGTIEDPQRTRPSRTIIEEVVNRKRAVLSVDTLSDRHFGSQDSIVAQAIRSVMCAPLLVGGEVLGLIQVDTSSDPYAFAVDDLELLTGVCSAAAISLKNLQLYNDIAGLLDGFVRASVQAIEERDPATAGHSFRVARYAEDLATAIDRVEAGHLRHIAFTSEQLREIRYAALLHDFGKVGVREHVLRKEKKLHHAEMRHLELRFKHARACLELRALRDLADQHCGEQMSIEEFRSAKRRSDIDLSRQIEELDRLLAAIRHANEPCLSSRDRSPELSGWPRVTFTDPDGSSELLLDDFQLSALSIAKGCLTAEERRQIEAHVADSYSFLILIPWTHDLAGVPAIAHAHHEKLDGSGYPMGLRGDQISIQARMLTICDIFDALTAGDRPYKSAVPVVQALDLIEAECQLGRLDPAVFRVFVEARCWSPQ
jgi:HD-GYP domain-containing protein (c-di-GMP phosphodiesterase class II)/pSer/pThr/pTyr-binding forkhead associated (FHA) protein